MEENFFNSQHTYIHPTSIIGNNVTFGENVKIGPFCVIVGNVFIDSNTRLHGHISIGMPAQDINTKKALGTIEIGKNCEIREFVTISSPKIENNKTKIGDNCYIMNFSHIAHDVTLENNVTIINNVNLGGHVHVEHHCMLMANTGVHQFCRIGAYSALAPYSGMRQDLPPFCLFDGAPGRFAGLNIIGLKRANCSAADRNCIKSITKLFFQDKLPFDTIREHVETDQTLQQSPYVQQFLQFVKNSERGISRKTIKDT
ncbi:acyl-ACP--UDP-N-acetylglucosamine O-acyltransferase [Candidatus Dependentiae bacterium]|nr:acyl-ACP--UDP-N-acetylglucosamine O-acyltransferase [Candidatus Dependentiae bacterium]